MYGMMKYAEAMEKAEHLIALGETRVFISEDGAPWSKADAFEAGGCYRLSGPVSGYVVAHEKGLALKWSVDFEERDANGRGVSLFDRARLRDVALRLPPAARQKFGAFLAAEVLPALTKRTAELRDALQQQWDSEDCVRGLIALTEQDDPPLSDRG